MRRRNEPHPCPADVSHYYQRLAELSTLPFWQREEFTDPADPSAGTSGTGMTPIPSSPVPASSRPTRPACNAALILRNPGLAPAGIRNLLTSGPVLATLSCLLEGLPAGASTRPHRETASSLIVVARGVATPARS
jgi:hypothetical protein